MQAMNSYFLQVPLCDLIDYGMVVKQAEIRINVLGLFI